MTTFVPAAHQTRTDYNFVSAYDAHKPEFYPGLVEPFGSQLITELMGMVGQKIPVSALEYNHHEADRFYPKVKATTGGAAAGATATFTVDASAIKTVNLNNSPYPATTVTKKALPVRQNDILLIKPTSGTVSSSTYIRAFVNATDATAGTFTAAPQDPADSIPSISSAAEIIIIGTAFGEGSNQPAGRSTSVTKYTNNLQIFKESYDITGSQRDVVLWWPVSVNGKQAWTWGLKGEDDSYKMFLNERELSLLLGEKITNGTIVDAQATADTPIRTTEGLIPFILSQGYVANYAQIAGFTLTDHETLVKNLDKNKGSRENLFMCGIELSLQIDREFRDVFKNGAISYGNFQFNQEKAVSLKFSTYTVGEYTFHKKTYDAFNDLQTLGADGYNFPKEGMVIPMDSQMDPKANKKVPSLAVRYLVAPDGNDNREIRVEPVDLLKVGDNGADKFQVRYLSECGFEGFGGNRYAYVKLV